MAERLKVFANKTFTEADLVNNKDFILIQNDATTQAVVRDVLVDEANTNISSNAALVNSGFTVSDTAVSMTGSDIVDKNGELKFELRPALSTGTFPFCARYTYAAGYGAVRQMDNHFFSDPPAQYPLKSGSIPVESEYEYQPSVSFNNTVVAVMWSNTNDSYKVVFLHPYRLATYSSGWGWAGAYNHAYGTACAFTFDPNRKVAYEFDAGFLYKRYFYSAASQQNIGSHSGANIHTSAAAVAGVVFLLTNGAIEAILDSNGSRTKFNTDSSGAVPFTQSYQSGINNSAFVCSVEDASSGTWRYFLTYVSEHGVQSCFIDSTTAGAATFSTSNPPVRISLNLTQTPARDRMPYGDINGNVFYIGTDNKFYIDNIALDGTVTNMYTGPAGYANSIPCVYMFSPKVYSLGDYDIRLTTKVSGVEITGV